MTSGRRVLDVSALPGHAFGPRGLIWWGTIGFMVIEASMFLMAFVAYFYLRLQVRDWPPGQANPELLYGTLSLAIAVAACVPAVLAQQAAKGFRLGGVRLWLGVLTVFGLANAVLRAYEFTALNCRWDENAYGSITWVVLGLHTLHVLTDVVDSAVLFALMCLGPIEEQRFVDVSENSDYWYFIVLWWVPTYLVVYVAPRWL